jgi:hypothetical protein
VPNDVYRQTHEGLSGIVSARAASRVLDAVLAAEREDAERISGARMSELLLGPIYRELRGALPRLGLKRQLRGLAGRIREVKSFDDVRLQGLVTFDPPAPSASPHATAPSAPSVAPSQVAVAVLEAEEAGRREPLGAEALSRIVLRFAQLDAVKLVTAIRSHGEVVASRGSAANLDALFRYGPTALRLLSRQRQVRSYYLSHTQGQLFLLPFEDDTVILIGTPELNLGTVFTTLSKLKEEL